MSIAYNYLIVYNKSTNRIEPFSYHHPHIPVIRDSYPEFEESTQYYRGLLNCYDPSIWSTTDRDTLDTSAAAALGIVESQIAYYTRDVTVSENLTTSYLWGDTLKVATLSAPALSAQQKYLGIVFSNSGGHISSGTGPFGLDEIQSELHRFFKRTWRDTYDPTVGPVIVTVTKYYADGTIDTTATDTITLIITRGFLSYTTRVMTAGIATFAWLPCLECGIASFEASSDQSDCDATTASLHIKSPDDDLNAERRTFTRTTHQDLSGTLSATGGPASDGVYGSIYLPEHPRSSANDYYQPGIIRVTAGCQAGPSGGDLVVHYIGETSGKVMSLTVPDGSVRISAAPTAVSGPTYYTPGEWVQRKVIYANGAADVSLEEHWE